MKRLSTAAAVPRSAALLTVALERPARCCDRAREPWIAFDGDLSAVSAAAAGAPVAWRLNGDAAVRRSYSGCNEQTLTIDTRAAVGPGSACARTSSNDGPDAVVHFRRLATSLGQAGAGGAADSRPRWRTVAPPLALRGSGAAHTLRVVYALARAQAARSTRECVESCAVCAAVLTRTSQRSGYLLYWFGGKHASYSHSLSGLPRYPRTKRPERQHKRIARRVVPECPGSPVCRLTTSLLRAHPRASRLTKRHAPRAPI